MMNDRLPVAVSALSFVAFCSGSAAAPELRGAETREASSAAVQGGDSSEDPYLWLEDVEGDRALDWARARNKVSVGELEAAPRFDRLRERLLAILNSDDQIPYLNKRGERYYNFWRDAEHSRGLWRRTGLGEYRKEAPEWETVLDLDALAEKEGENWVWKGATTLWPNHDRALLFLSRGGADATVIREFDLEQKRFVEDGFFVPEAKSSVAWKDRDTLYVGTDFGDGSLTASGYPRLVKEWKRGTELSSARLLFEGEPDDVSVRAGVTHDRGRRYDWISRAMTFYTNERRVRRGEKWVKIEKPADAMVDTFGDQILLELRSDWELEGRRYAAGSLLAGDFASYMQGNRDLAVLFEPSDRVSLSGFDGTRNYILINALDNVRERIHAMRLREGHWRRQDLDLPDAGNLSISGVDPEESDDFFLTASGFLTPATYYLGTVGEKELEPLKKLPEFFEADGREVRQFEATSQDGTRIPYFQVSPVSLELDGNAPTLLYGYGGFEISLLPRYSAEVGAGWLERGGVYVVANIRGGGEFGPRWHQAALKENRQRAYDDFIAVAEDLIRRGVASPQSLGIMGGSNGGLLMGAMFTQRPDLFKAVVCRVPLLDMKRYNKLLAGASWMGEYGNPDLPEEWDFIRRYSPYQNVRADRDYPRILFMTSTRDDRVHPGHARKMAARMLDQGHDILYYENIEGGHGGAANNEQRAYLSALAYTFLWKELAPQNEPPPEGEKSQEKSAASIRPPR